MKRRVGHSQEVCVVFQMHSVSHVRTSSGFSLVRSPGTKDLKNGSMLGTQYLGSDYLITQRPSDLVPAAENAETNLTPLGIGVLLGVYLLINQRIRSTMHT